jgi:Spy/CpxP family protein refolding chaperone
MQLKKLTGIAMATAAAGMFAMTAAAPVAAQDAKIHCEGVNSCKGHSDCKSGKSSCKGLNECKGQGFMSMTKAECNKAKAAMKK